MRRAILLASLLTAGVLLSISQASAAPTTRTVCPSGCDFTDIQSAINASTTGDTVDIMASGSPYVITTGINDTKEITVQGDPSGPRPVITDGVAGQTTFTLNNTSSSTSGPKVIQHLEIDATGDATSTAVSLTGFAEGTHSSPGNPAALRDALVNSSGVGVAMNAGEVQQATVNGTTNGVTSAKEGGFVFGTVVTASNGTALLAAKTNAACSSSCDPPHDLQAVNVDAIASGVGLEAQGTPDITANFPGTIASTNTIARGGAGDIVGDAPPSGADPAGGQIFVDHSNFRTTSGTIVAGSGNQNSDPKFVNGTIGPSQNFHLQAGSPAIAAGVDDPPGSTIDADGNPFISPPEIGAYRVIHPPKPSNCAAAFVTPSLKTHKKGKAHKKGKITISAHFPCAGKLKITATVKVKVRVKTKHGFKTKTKTEKWAKVVKVSRNAAGLVVIELKPNKNGQRLLKAARRKHQGVKVKVAFKFTATSGGTSKKSKTIKVK